MNANISVFAIASCAVALSHCASAADLGLASDASQTFRAVYPQSFEGGWKLDCQFMDVIGSPCLLAHGMGRPVPDSRAVVELPEAGRWRVAVRAKNWLPEDCDYPTSAADYPGSFRVLIDGAPLAKTFGRGPKAWTWEDGGEVCCSPASGFCLPGYSARRRFASAGSASTGRRR